MSWNPFKVKETSPSEPPSEALVIAKKELPVKQEGTNPIFIENLHPLQEVFPNLEIIGAEQEVPRADRIPSLSSNYDEPVWLTDKAVQDRLQVLMCSRPEFNIRPSIVAGEFHGTSDTGLGAKEHKEVNIRKGVPNQETVNVFQAMGYSFVLDKQGKVVMLVDATIPRKDNTDGRFKKIHLATRNDTTSQTVIDGSAMVSSDMEKIGVRPADAHSRYALAIPVDKLLELHKEMAPVEVMYMGRSGPNPMMNPYRDLSINDRQALFAVCDSLVALMKSDAALNQELLGIFKLQEGDQRKKLFEIFNRLGIKAHLFGDGTLPYEPTYTFAHKIAGHSEAVSLQELQYDPTIRPETYSDDWVERMTRGAVYHDDPSPLMLQDLMWAVETAQSRIAAKNDTTLSK